MRVRDVRWRGARFATVWPWLAACSVAGILLWSTPVSAQDDKVWSQVFGEGMRAWAESDYDRALESLYQAYALKPTAYNLSLIVRSHDFLGECDAAMRQREEFDALYDKKKSPALQQCASRGSLTLECPATKQGLKIMIAGKERGVCDREIVLPAGAHEVSVPEVGFAASVTVEDSGSHRHALTAKSKSGPQVSKLLSTADRYTIFMTPDGLYQIWVLNDDPELLHPYEGNSCTRTDSVGKASCKPLTKTQRDELEKVAPMILLLPD